MEDAGLYSPSVWDQGHFRSRLWLCLLLLQTLEVERFREEQLPVQVHPNQALTNSYLAPRLEASVVFQDTPGVTALG